MDHPYAELGKTRLWAAVESAIKDLVSNNDLVESTNRPYIVGYLCKKLLNEGMSVVAETLNSDNFLQMEWDESYFKFCNFADFNSDVTLISSDFNWCTFTNVEWYGGLFTGCNFIYCTFTNCTFAGTSFGDSRFVDCTLVDCTFKKDNLGGDCDFSGAVVYGCSVKNSVGFKPDTGVDLSNAGK